MRRRASVLAGGAALSAASVAIGQAQLEQTAAIKQALAHVEDGSRMPSSVLEEHGVCIVRSALSCESVLGSMAGEIDVGAAASAAGKLTAMALPTVHQMDSLRNMDKGQLMGQRLAVKMYGLLNRPSLEGCLHAVAVLRPHMAARPGVARTRALDIQPEWEDEQRVWLPNLEEKSLLKHLWREERSPSTAPDNPLLNAGPRAALLRQWSSLLLQPTSSWTHVLAGLCQRRGCQLTQHNVCLVVPDEQRAQPQSGGAEDTEGHHAALGGVWMDAAHRLTSSISYAAWSTCWWCSRSGKDGVLVLLPLQKPLLSVPVVGDPPSQSTAQLPHARAVRLEVQLPDGWLPSVLLDVRPGSAVLLDGRASWRFVPCTDTDAIACPCPYLSFRYQQGWPFSAHSTMTDTLASLAKTILLAALAAVCAPPLVLEESCVQIVPRFNRDAYVEEP
ncbi:hypothetical protein AB1Y20_019309 [Prymnesium parvum]|uniref:Bifunctional lysine-specific demethylase and histidyl-hydroxylase n=1 Tax=Prymnesium parvum TaxID=97485 RepID=A0AB34JQV3_PRYPA